MIVPFPPGGPNDIFARLVAQLLQDALGQQVVVDNRGGAGGSIGAELAARAAPDGYSLLLGGAAILAISPSMGRRLPYDAMKDFTPISLLATAPSVLLAHPGLPVRSVKELIALARAKTRQIAYASAGVRISPENCSSTWRASTSCMCRTRGAARPRPICWPARCPSTSRACRSRSPT
jgi:tripartite-type tricarboxylate transporter receptor subunit TctC